MIEASMNIGQSDCRDASNASAHPTDARRAFPQTIPIHEHEPIPEQYHEQLSSVKFIGTPDNYMGEPTYLGIGTDFRASYYIGATWLIPNEFALVVTPKMPNIDFISMFLAALGVDTQRESDYFSQCYGIQFDEPSIETDETLNQLTPLLVLHFISLLERLVKHGLKKDYIIHEENIKAKVKGRILFGRHLKTNVFQQRADRIYCQYQDYTDDTPENRLLKKALLFSERMLSRCESLNRQDIQLKINKLKAVLSHISDDIEPYQVQKISSNKLFKGYKETIKVAKMILRRFDYSLREASSEQHTTPPFWIDMARLYEMWVFCKLQKASKNPILFQEAGFYGRQVADFVIREEKLILDAKYKPNYTNGNWVDIDDIRELSGNARDDRLLPDLPEEYSPRCIILYPGDKDELKTETEIHQQGQKIAHYRNFYKISIPLPLHTPL